MNYTRVNEEAGGKFNLAPRKQFCGVSLGADIPDEIQGDTGPDPRLLPENATSSFINPKPFPSRDWFNNGYRPIRAQGCLMLLDTDRERQIGLGSRYPHKAMKEGECMLNEMMASKLNVAEGDIMFVRMSLWQDLVAIVDMFNKKVAGPMGVRKINRESLRRASPEVSAMMPCRVAHIGNQSYGKVPNDAIGEQIFMEYKHFLPHFAKYMPQGILSENRLFVEFLRNQAKFNSLFEIADFLMVTLPSPRVNFYKSSDFYQIQKGVISYLNKV